jgi:hypothetical protein
LTSAALEAHLRLGGKVDVRYSHSQSDPIRMLCTIAVPDIGVEIVGPWTPPGKSFAAALHSFLERFPGDQSFRTLLANAMRPIPR